VNRPRLALLAGALAVAGAISLRLTEPGASARPADVVAPPAATPVAPRHTAPVPAPARDIFEYVSDPDEGESGPPRIARPAVVLPAPPSLASSAPPVPEGPRLIGIVRQGGALSAAIVVDGEVLVVRAGERAGPYAVLAIDEDEGVRLGDPSGATVVLTPPGE
jgi:hypothetical protein